MTWRIRNPSCHTRKRNVTDQWHFRQQLFVNWFPRMHPNLIKSSKVKSRTLCFSTTVGQATVIKGLSNVITARSVVTLPTHLPLDLKLSLDRIWLDVLESVSISPSATECPPPREQNCQWLQTNQICRAAVMTGRACDITSCYFSLDVFFFGQAVNWITRPKMREILSPKTRSFSLAKGVKCLPNYRPFLSRRTSQKTGTLLIFFSNSFTLTKAGAKK